MAGDCITRKQLLRRIGPMLWQISISMLYFRDKISSLKAWESLEASLGRFVGYIRCGYQKLETPISKEGCSLFCLSAQTEHLDPAEPDLRGYCRCDLGLAVYMLQNR
jgi:hypothetical protein